MILNRYAAALLSIAVVVVGAFTAIPEGQVSPTAILQLAIIAVGSVVTYLVPVVQGSKWAGVLKTGAAIIAAVLTAVVPFVNNGHITATQIGLVILAALNALAVEVGVNIRRDNNKLSNAITQGVTLRAYEHTEDGH